jgi:hypothetical protein
MFENLREWVDLRVLDVVRGWRSIITDINKKYSKPRIKMTRGVRTALLLLRLYLIFLVLVLGYRFVSLALGGG